MQEHFTRNTSREQITPELGTAMARYLRPLNSSLNTVNRRFPLCGVALLSCREDSVQCEQEPEVRQ